MALKEAPWKTDFSRDTIPEAMACGRCDDESGALKCVALS